jgi:hypothetical protein
MECTPHRVHIPVPKAQEEVWGLPRYLLFWNEVFWPKVPAEKREEHKVNSAEGWRDLLNDPPRPVIKRD